MAKKKTNMLGFGIIALIVGAVGAAIAGVMTNKKARKAVARQLQKAEKKVARKSKKRK